MYAAVDTYLFMDIYVLSTLRLSFTYNSIIMPSFHLQSWIFLRRLSKLFLHVPHLSRQQPSQSQSALGIKRNNEI